MLCRVVHLPGVQLETHFATHFIIFAYIHSGYIYNRNLQ